MDWLSLALCLLPIAFFTGCCCGGCISCEIATDNFAGSADPPNGWTERVGTDWATAGTLTTSTSNSRIVFDTPHPGGNKPCKFSFDFGAVTAGLEYIAMIAWQDDSNYYFAKITVPASGDPYAGCVALYSRIAGVDTLLTVRSAYIHSGITNRITLWYTDQFLAAEFSTTSSLRSKIWIEVPAIAGSKVGLGTGSITGTVWFDNFVFNCIKYGSENPSCTEFTELCGWTESLQQSSSSSCAFTYSGTWAQASNLLKCTSTNAKATSLTAIPRTIGDGLMICGATASAVGDIARFYLNNDVYVEAEPFTATYTGGPNLYLRLYDAGGLVASTETGHIGYAIGLTICYENGLLVVSSVTRFIVEAMTITDFAPAIGTGASVSGGGISFSAFQFSMLEDDLAGCNHCTIICPGCDAEVQSPEGFDFACAGMASVTPPFNCPGTICTDLNATFHLSQSGGCSWNYLRDLDASEKCGAYNRLSIALSLAFDALLSGYTWRMQMVLSDGLGNFIIFYNRTTAAAASWDCTDTLTHTDFVTDLGTSGGGFGGVQCNASSITFSLTPTQA